MNVRWFGNYRKFRRYSIIVVNGGLISFLNVVVESCKVIGTLLPFPKIFGDTNTFHLMMMDVRDCCS